VIENTASNLRTIRRGLIVMTVAAVVVAVLLSSGAHRAVTPSVSSFVTPFVDPAAVLDEALVRATSGFSGRFVREHMAPSDASYSDVHLRARTRPETYDVALRVWTLPVAARAGKLAELHRDLPNVTGIASAFFSEDPEIVGAVFEDDCGAIVMLTCGRQQCRDTHAAADLARQIRKRLRVRCRI